MQTNINPKIHNKLLNDFPFYAYNALTIKDKAGEEIPLALNQAQRIAHKALEQQKKKTGKVRALVLKARQLGSSTYVGGRFFHKASTEPGNSVFILSHDSSTTAKLFDMAKRYYEHVPTSLRPALKKSNARELIFSDINSQYAVGTAGSADVGRGGTVKLLHGSEVAFWKNAEDLRTGVLESVPDLPGSEIILESTANGMGNMFHQMCVDALEGKSEYQLIFIPWYVLDDYETEPEDGFEYTKDEKEFVGLYLQEYSAKVQKRKMQWRRNKIATLGKIWRFKQEYPSNANEAFQTSGESLVNPEDIMRARKCNVKYPDSPLIVGVDPARKGDRSVICLRRYKEMPKYYVWNDMDEVRLAAIVADIINRYNPVMVNSDVANGYGMIDILHSRGYEKIVNPVHFGQAALQPEIYANKRVEMCCSVRDWLAQERVNIPDDDELHMDLSCVPDVKETVDGPARLESKKTIRSEYGKSPDIFDALALTFAFPVPMKHNTKKITVKKAGQTKQDMWSKNRVSR